MQAKKTKMRIVVETNGIEKDKDENKQCRQDEERKLSEKTHKERITKGFN